jgi:hypothetical protein
MSPPASPIAKKPKVKPASNLKSPPSYSPESVSMGTRSSPMSPPASPIAKKPKVKQASKLKSPPSYSPESVSMGTRSSPMSPPASPIAKKPKVKPASKLKSPPSYSPESVSRGTRSSVYLKDPAPRPVGHTPTNIPDTGPESVARGTRSAEKRKARFLKLPTHPLGPPVTTALSPADEDTFDPKPEDETAGALKTPSAKALIEGGTQTKSEEEASSGSEESDQHSEAENTVTKELATNSNEEASSKSESVEYSEDDDTVENESVSEVISLLQTKDAVHNPPINLDESLLAVAEHSEMIVRQSEAAEEIIDVEQEIIEIFDSPTKKKETCSIPRSPKVQSCAILPHSGLRAFDYPLRRWIPAPDKLDNVFIPDPTEVMDPDLSPNQLVYVDNYHDFPKDDFDPPKLKHIVKGFQFPEILRCIQDSTHWLNLDYIGYYTSYSQRSRSQYDNASDYFPVYFPSGEQSRIHSCFRSRQGDPIYDTPHIRQQVLTACWKLFHPGSYYLYLKEKIQANPVKYQKWLTKRRRELAETLGKVPLDFNVFNKRVISIVACDDSHFVTYCVVNLGAWLTKEDKKDSGVAKEQPSTFIVDHDSLYGEGSASTYQLVYFILEIARSIELWVAPYLALKVGDPLPDPPDHNAIICDARVTVRKKKALIMQIPRVKAPDCPLQSDQFNCGVFSALNVYSVFRAEKEGAVRLDLINNVEEWSKEIVRPFWGLEKGWADSPGRTASENADRTRLTKRASSFRYCLLEIMLVKFHQNTVDSEIDPWMIDYLISHGLEALLSEQKKGEINERRLALEPDPASHEELALSDWGCHYLHLHGFDHWLPDGIRVGIEQRRLAGASIPLKSPPEFCSLYAEFKEEPTEEEVDAAAEKKNAPVVKKILQQLAKDITKAKLEAADLEVLSRSITDPTSVDKMAHMMAEIKTKIETLEDKAKYYSTTAAERLGIPEGAAEGTAKANPGSTANPPTSSSSDESPTLKKKKKKKLKDDSPTIKTKSELKDNTAVGKFFSQGETTAAEQKKHTERIRRRRGRVRARLHWKKTEEEKMEYVRRHEAIFTRRENVVAADRKRRIEKKRKKAEEWRKDLKKLDVILSQPKKLTKKEEKMVDDLLSHNFPDKTPPPSDSESAYSLDSQLTSDTSDDGNYSDQTVTARSIRKMARVQKREMKKIRTSEKGKRKREAKVKIAEFATREPAPTLASDVLQISKLRYIPGRRVKENQDFDVTRGTLTVTKRSKKKVKQAPGTVKWYPPRYQSLTVNAEGNTEVNHSISTSWVGDVFAPKFLDFVRSVGTKEEQNKVQWTKRRWIRVPVGRANTNEPPDEIICPRVRCRYLQHDFNTCVFMSMASAFHHAGQKETANFLASISHARGSEHWDARSQVDRLMTEVRKRDSVYCKVDFRSSKKAIAKVNIFNPEPCPQLWILLGRDGGTNHAVAVFGEYIFDSNVSTALTLSQQTLDWCSNCEQGFSRIHMYVRFGK